MHSTMGYTQGSRAANLAGSYMHGLGSPYRPNRYQAHGNFYAQTPPSSTDNLSYNQAAMNNLAQNFGAASLSGNAHIGVGKATANSMAANGVQMNSMLGMQSAGQPFYYQVPDANMMLSGMATAQVPYSQYSSGYNMNYGMGSYAGQQAYTDYGPSMTQGMPTGLRYGNYTTSQHLSNDVPELSAPRRSSLSSNDESGPKTPFNTGNYPNGAHPTVYGAGDNSLSPWDGEPSPIQLSRNFPFEQLWRTPNGGYEYVDYYAKTREDPIIPVAVPAKMTKDSGRGTFDKILDNEHGTTNVYIRGLWPNTTDEKLHGYGARFGDIVSCKAIIDLNNGYCKGFGFIMYHNYTDAENCIRCFYYLGYEAKFAKLSHNERLKNCADMENNNLYASNLPKAMTETELKALFTDVFPSFKVTSTKVLKDSQGISRGVGFVRFETHDICEKVLDHFSKNPIHTGDDDATLQLRYADSEAQKQLKRDSAAHRAFKADEYNQEAFGPSSPFHNTTLTPVYPSPIMTIAARSNGSWRRQNEVSPVSSLLSSQPLFGSNLQPTAITALKTEQQNLISTYPRNAGSTAAESRSVSAADNRITNDVESVACNTSEQSSNDAAIKEESSNLDANTKPVINIETLEDSVGAASKLGSSPLKPGMSKL